MLFENIIVWIIPEVCSNGINSSLQSTKCRSIFGKRRKVEHNRVEDAEGPHGRSAVLHVRPPQLAAGDADGPPSRERTAARDGVLTDKALLRNAVETMLDEAQSDEGGVRR
eukprot:gene2758-3456_t